ncbi:ABC transporter substrate-binding protein [Flavobacterium alkalisoli]|uniref:ABC transporter substrate-binding protein n=1 Tax=Flavobacterium alkalisoli TaxID=2602769 RepID=A0A5B9FRW8_9FLAO|nr:helical backbone metal receptor [Flavobacterium alkalisoli]QEE48826.1 ABC transporter substrate-binding protein [Flavobacterium alkalisoli]
MKKISLIVFFAISLFTATSCKNDVSKTEETTAEQKIETQRIISLNGAITEVVAALGHEKEIVGVDVTSTYPETVKSTAKDLGHVRSISVETVMELKPTLILATDKDLNPTLIENLKASGITVKVFSQDISVDGTKKLIAEVANTLNNNNYEKLQNDIDNDLAQVKPIEKTPKVLFIYARGANMLMVSGTNTPVDKVITLAGGQNAVSEFEDYKPLTPEALLQGNPDVILMFDSGLGSVGGPNGIFKIPGVDKTNAGKNKKIIAMDGGLLAGFGPRLGEAAVQLNTLLRENAK